LAGLVKQAKRDKIEVKEIMEGRKREEREKRGRKVYLWLAIG
jgi:hypothetical protein